MSIVLNIRVSPCLLRYSAFSALKQSQNHKSQLCDQVYHIAFASNGFIEELKKQWTMWVDSPCGTRFLFISKLDSEQLELRRKAIFENHNLTFHSIPNSVIQLHETGASDYDEPIVHNEDPNAFTVSGLKYVGGLDISFITQEEDTVENVNYPSHNASDPSLPDAYAVITVLEYPTLTVSSPASIIYISKTRH
jgi:hypothetical protein